MADECSICKVEATFMKSQPQAVPHEVLPARFAVKDSDGIILLVCPKHIEEFYNMHETVLLVGDTYIPREDESS